jgi:hypothetical protein
MKKTTVPGKNGKLNGTAPRKRASRKTAPPKPPTQPAPAMRTLDDDHDLARGFRLEDLLTELEAAPKSDKLRKQCVRDAITARADEWGRLNVVRRFLVQHHQRLSDAFSSTPVAARFLLEELMIEAADYQLKCEPEEAGCPARELAALVTRAANRLRFYAGVMRRGEPDPAAPAVSEASGARTKVCGAVMGLEGPINQSMALMELLLGSFIEWLERGSPLNFEDKVNGLVRLVAQNEQQLKSALDAACATVAPPATAAGQVVRFCDAKTGKAWLDYELDAATLARLRRVAGQSGRTLPEIIAQAINWSLPQLESATTGGVR